MNKIDPDALEILFRGVSEENPSDIIVEQEKRGQNTFNQSETLPLNIRTENGRQILEGWGTVFGEPIDDLFVEVQLPDGWEKKPREHHMWSDLIDDQGRKRASIFYKAAFYDRDAFMGLNRRYSYTSRPLGGHGSDNENDEWCGVVLDGDEIIFETNPTQRPEDKPWRMREQLEKQAREWLQGNYPEWENYEAYW